MHEDGNVREGVVVVHDVPQEDAALCAAVLHEVGFGGVQALVQINGVALTEERRLPS